MHRAHPHVCGEHCWLPVWAWPPPGSSPRMRGTRPRTHEPPTRGGLIPTYAGNTSTGSPPPVNLRAHPHVCGEHNMSKNLELLRQGSSPRMRGTPTSSIRFPRESGLIPTYAGNTIHMKPNPRRPWAHPHVCGEHLRIRAEPAESLGSSPRMRGTHRVRASSALLSGLIPTYAGNTWPHAGQAAHGRAHPHVCGEHL